MCCPNWKLTPRMLCQAYPTRFVSVNRYFARGVSRKNHKDAMAHTIWCQSQASSETSVGGSPAGDVDFFCVDSKLTDINKLTWATIQRKKRRYPYFGSGQFHSIFTSNFSQQSMWRTIVRSSSQHLKQRISVSVVPGWFVLMSGCFPIHTVVRLVHPGCLGRKRKHPQHHKLHRQPGRCKSKKIVTGTLCNNIVLSVIWLVLQIRSSSGFICERMPNHWQEQLSLASWCVSLAEQCNRHRPFPAKKVPQRDPRRTCGGFPSGESERSDFPWCSLA